jgi:hypothetical protein
MREPQAKVCRRPSVKTMLDGGGASIERIACKKCLESHVYPRKTLGLKLQRAKRTKICEHLTVRLRCSRFAPRQARLIDERSGSSATNASSLVHGSLLPLRFEPPMQRKVFTTPVPAELKDVESPDIVPSERRLNKKRGCAAVSIGEKRHRSERRSSPRDLPTESGLCVKTLLCDLRAEMPRRAIGHDVDNAVKRR